MQIRIKTRSSTFALLPWLLPRAYNAGATYAKARAKLKSEGSEGSEGRGSEGRGSQNKNNRATGKTCALQARATGKSSF
jgi:hypothetical protein